MMAGLRLECKPMTEIERIIEKKTEATITIFDLV